MLFDTAVTASVCPTSFAGPTVIPERLTVCSPELCGIGAGSGMALSVGSSFTALTVIVNDMGALWFTLGAVPLPLSVATALKVAVPFALAADV